MEGRFELEMNFRESEMGFGEGGERGDCSEARVRVDKTFSKDEGERVDGAGPFITRWDQVERKGGKKGEWHGRSNKG